MSTDSAVPRGAVGLDDARQALGRGAAVVLPNPAPLTHVVTATRPQTVNEAKARPPGQPVALWAHHAETLRTLAEVTELDAAGTALAGRLLTEEHLTLLLPLRAGTRQPAWLAPACKDGWVLLFGARWQPLRPLLDEHRVLYVSSANRTGHPPAATTSEALAMFPATVPVLQPPHPVDDPAGGPPRRATTTVTLHPDGRLTLHRHGAQDQPYPYPDEYLEHLRARYASPPPPPAGLKIHDVRDNHC
ncbi:Sua5/YciO/YrdC/YwlC family protein [Streptomyces sp. NBC_00320]|uniref:Sua5/YciO/YrdC/YwlC family protein n=1 Tax=Streptomyces sp. NBC_00320 TaxID=2975711 RepID=UPI0022537FBF|nr:Sua5/YciO/YrdC/YwlC family protein [Streptomyces sp. NBC_00320]MCX5149951.1 Sua5/YciO/YrdC/YwlC family protein [Streptomyces sp. NBC_00320]